MTAAVAPTRAVPASTRTSTGGGASPADGFADLLSAATHEPHAGRATARPTRDRRVDTDRDRANHDTDAAAQASAHPASANHDTAPVTSAQHGSPSAAAPTLDGAGAVPTGPAEGEAAPAGTLPSPPIAVENATPVPTSEVTGSATSTPTIGIAPIAEHGLATAPTTATSAVPGTAAATAAAPGAPALPGPATEHATANTAPGADQTTEPNRPAVASTVPTATQPVETDANASGPPATAEQTDAELPGGEAAHGPAPSAGNHPAQQSTQGQASPTPTDVARPDLAQRRVAAAAQDPQAAPVIPAAESTDLSSPATSDRAFAAVPPAPATTFTPVAPATEAQPSGGPATAPTPSLSAPAAATAAALVEHLPSPGTEGRLVMRLDPPELGHLTVVMRRDNTGLHFRVTSDAPLTAPQVAVLREAATQAASAAGLDLARFDTSADPDGRHPEQRQRDLNPDSDTRRQPGQPGQDSAHQQRRTGRGYLTLDPAPATPADTTTGRTVWL